MRVYREVLTSAHLDASAARLKKEKFNALSLDLRMPPPDGIELTRQIRSSRLNRVTPVIVITGETEHGVSKTGRLTERIAFRLPRRAGTLYQLMSIEVCTMASSSSTSAPSHQLFFTSSRMRAKARSGASALR
ncbi:MAG: hypothetical protein DMG30_12765 [Acidobacteria bacterium]|nr:MAG: hypothetical protein DMG30_12765 [Acidobacteriota bacterium]